MSAYLDLVFLLVAAVFIFARLRSVLGTRPEDDEPAVLPQSTEWPISNEKKKQIMEALQKAGYSSEESPTDAVLAQIPGFSRADFCTRASKVFEMVLEAFAACDEETLKMLTGRKLFNSFHSIIQKRQEEGVCAESDLIRIEEMDIKDAQISAKGVAQIVVRFVSEQVNVLKNAAGEIIEGDENFVQKITDVWTFEKNINTSSPVWLLVSTKKK